MIIRKIRLKNIKSFGTGPEGNGVVVSFDQGLNRLGGRNGSGKSSVIEAIGYALFDAEPVRGDNKIRVETYLVRSGNKIGEIDLWIETGDCLYRIERDAGQTLRRWKVVREDDGFQEAEGEQEVRLFLARLLGLSGPERLSEVFHGLIGVKQGRFTLPFDCIPSFARNHFDPLLDVDIFRQCFDYLLEPYRLLNEERNQTLLEIESFQGQIIQLEDAPERVVRVEANLRLAREQMERIAGEIGERRETVKNHETAFRTKNDAEKTLSGARTVFQEALTRRETAAQAVKESEAACEILRVTGKEYQIYRTGEEKYREWEAQRKTRDLLTREENNLIMTEGRLEEEKRNLGVSLANYQDLARQKRENAKTRLAQLEDRKQVFRELEIKAEEQSRKHQDRLALWDKARLWFNSLQTVAKQVNREISLVRRLTEELAGYDRSNLTEANRVLEEANRTETEVRVALGKAEQQKTGLSQQLESIKGGVCPFLGEDCRQFNPELVQNQLEAQEQAIKKLAVSLAKAREDTAAAKERLSKAERREKEILEKEQSLKNCNANLRQYWGQAGNSEARQAVDELDQLWPSAVIPELIPAPVAEGEEESAFWDDAPLVLERLNMALQDGLAFWKENVTNLGKESQSLNGEREKEKGWLEQETEQIRVLVKETETFLQKAGQDEQRIQEIDQKLAEIRGKLREIRGKLREYSGLDENMAMLREELEELKPVYTRYLQNEPVASRLPERLNLLEEAREKGVQAEKAVREVEAVWKEAAAGYNEAVHQQDQERLGQALQAHGEIQSRFEQTRVELEEQRLRHQRLAGILDQRKEKLRELDRLRSRTVILEKARVVLKNSQTLVAGSLTRRIQARAQGIYNSMSLEPVSFEWEAGDYRLTVNTPSGSRRFGQLSGGQQMKVALAMQLALVKEFSTAGFCAFDEPTYGLDAESRGLLAEAVVRAAEECQFEQLLVISHDQAFDDRVEHVVNLEYSSAQGTKVGDKV